MKNTLNKNNASFFLRFFTYTLIKSKYYEQKRNQEIENEEIRRKQEIEIQKLRKRFSQYIDEISEDSKDNAFSEIVSPIEINSNTLKNNLESKKTMPTSYDSQNYSPSIVSQKPFFKNLPNKQMNTSLTRIPSRHYSLGGIQPQPRNLVKQSLHQNFNQNKGITNLTQKNNLNIQKPLINSYQDKITSSQKSDFYSINPFIIDPSISLIECYGPGQNINIVKRGERIRTSIILNFEEIQLIIKSFSDKARVPLIEGLFKAKIGDLSISAIISKSASLSFVISKKTPYSLVNSNNMNRNYKPLR